MFLRLGQYDDEALESCLWASVLLMTFKVRSSLQSQQAVCDGKSGSNESKTIANGVEEKDTLPRPCLLPDK